ncbi:MAG: AAA family ATPase, partial [Myxococcota bacterium]
MSEVKIIPTRIVHPQGPLPRGTDDFGEAMKAGCCLVDKSLFIREVLHNNDRVALITRPRRFGKTTNLSMLKHFFEHSPSHPSSQQTPLGGQQSAQREPAQKEPAQQQRMQCLFAELLIAQDEQAMQHQGRYPVIALTFKNVKASTWEQAYSDVCDVLYEEIQRHPESREWRIGDFEHMHGHIWPRILDRTATISDWKNALKLLCKLLTLHHKQSPWLLLDEYDAPIHKAYVQSQHNKENLQAPDSYYDQAVSFMRGLLGAALKGNDTFLHKAVITGILRVAKEDIFSDLNNLGVYGVMDWKFDNCFGFTSCEVQQLFQQRGIQKHLQPAQQWYDGYQLGRQEMYNPWSIVSFACNLPQPPQEYWVNTGSTSLIEHLVDASNTWDKQAIETLLLGQSIERDVADNLPLRELQKFSESLWSVMLTSGYVTAVDTIQGVLGKQATLRVPNQEIHIAFQRMAKRWFNTIENNSCPLMLQALLGGDTDGFAKHLNQLITCTLSFFDLATPQSERSYHLFILGLLSHLSGNYKVRSNRESGLGRPD